jgi:hypothetical protein
MCLITTEEEVLDRVSPSLLAWWSTTGCPTTYRTRHFINNSKTNEDIATRFEQEYVHCVRNEEECVCSAPNYCDTEQRSANQPACILPDVPLCLSLSFGWGCLDITFVVRECTVWVHTVGKCIGILLRSECLLFAWPKFSSFLATASFGRDFGPRARPIWRRLIISYGDIWKGNFTNTNHEP